MIGLKVWQGKITVQTTALTVGCLVLSIAAASLGQSGSKQIGPPDPLQQFNTDGLSVPHEQILAGGPLKDGIPSLTNPKTGSIAETYYADDSRMVVVTVGESTRAYPINILNWHEAINDKLEDIPLAVIYCPLCDSVSVVDRRIGSDTLEFGISGLLYNSNVLLYDRKNNALWSQVGLRAMSGPDVGKSLKHLPWEITSYGQVRKRYPNASVVSTDNGYHRDYSRNPYARYFTTDQLMFPVFHEDSRLGLMTAVVGVEVGNQTRAYPVATIAAAGRAVSDRLGDHEITLKADEAGGVTVVEAPTDARIVHTFWFAWAAFHPDTSVFGGQASDD